MENFNQYTREQLLEMQEALMAALAKKDKENEGFEEKHNLFGKIAFQPVHRRGNDVTFWMKDLLMRAKKLGFEFDAVEALAACPRGLNAGTYHDGEIEFTLDRPVLPGCLIRLDLDTEEWEHTGVSVFASLFSKKPLFTVPFTYGKGGVALEDALGVDNVNYDPKNFSNTKWRSRYGSNNPAQSAIHKWLNSAAAAGEWFYPSHKFDMTPSYADLPGFLAGFSEEFLAKLKMTEQVCATNKYYEIGYERNSSYSMPCLFYLPSYTQLTGQKNNGVLEGEQWDAMEGVYKEVYENWSCERLVKHGIGDDDPIWYWIRSCDPDYSYNVHVVSTGGHANSDGNAAIPMYGTAAACTITI